MATRITESFEYNTNILTSYDGHEQRIMTRQYPRHSVSYDYDAMNKYDSQWLRGMMRIRQSDIWFVPMWQNVGYLSENFLRGKAMMVDPLYMYGFNNCDLIEVFVKDDINQDGKVNTIKEVKSYSFGRIELKKAINRVLLKENTWIMPCIRVSEQPSSTANYVFSNGTTVTLNFEDILYRPTANIPFSILNNYDYTKERNRFGLPENIEEREILTFTPQWINDDSNTVKIDKNVTKLDNVSGVFMYDLKNSKSYDTHTLDLYMMGKAMINNVIRFFKNMKGMYKSFYAPSWANDLEISDNLFAGSNYMYTKWTNMYQYYLSNKRRKKLVVFTKDWKAHIFDINYYTYEVKKDRRYGKVLLSQPIKEYIDKDNILMASFLNLVRLDSDKLQLNYESNVCANCTLTMREVDDDD